MMAPTNHVTLRQVDQGGHTFRGRSNPGKVGATLGRCAFPPWIDDGKLRRERLAHSNRVAHTNFVTLIENCSMKPRSPRQVKDCSLNRALAG